ncbi:hypothetical protein CNR22_16975 [Sphingobacteriaceae bacterium]|nr:hypothetical protein CNR22_16975 [Sphingobacteriaceae bacterium]
MQFALYNSRKHSAEPGLKGSCLHCSNEVIAKCGTKNIWHWAHVKSDACDAWTEPETAWHRDWKNKFGVDFSEIRIQKDNCYHIADVFTKNEIVFEFQNSPISSEIIKAREEFYGDKMIWVVNGIPFKETFHTYDELFLREWRFTILDEFAATLYPQIKNCLIIEDWQVKTDVIKKFLSERGFHYNNEFKLYTLDMSLNKFASREQLILKLNNEVLELYNLNKSEGHSTKVEFAWEHARKSWQDVQRPVFIDFGQNYLLLVTKGMGKKNGLGNKILKSKFIEKYCL